jgi:integrase/recombinase XerC
MLQGVLVEYYGSMTPIQQVANVNTMDARTIVVQPWEKNMLNDIAKGIMNANLGLNPQSEWVFNTAKGEQLYPNYVYRAVKELLSRYTTLKKKSPHILRHTFATHMLNSGSDLNAIKELLGHANLSATQIYTHNSIERLKEVYNKAHPKGKG